MTDPEKVYTYCILKGFGKEVANQARLRSELRQTAKDMFSFFPGMGD